jgi:hypothetical protein
MIFISGRYKEVRTSSNFMLQDGSQVGGEVFYIRDSYVWAEIYYLDSSTDYREYLPQYASVPKVNSEFMILDSSPKFSSIVNAPAIVTTLLAAIIGVVFLFLVYSLF